MDAKRNRKINKNEEIKERLVFSKPFYCNNETHQIARKTGGPLL